MSTKNIVIAVVILVVLVIVAYLVMKGNYSASSSSVQPSITASPSPVATGSETSQIEIKNFSFNPSAITVKTGATVTWTNNDPVPHTITSDPDGSVFKSSTLQPGETFQFTFNTAGTFAYHCSIHTSMQGSVTVTP